MAERYGSLDWFATLAMTVERPRPLAHDSAFGLPLRQVPRGRPLPQAFAPSSHNDRAFARIAALRARRAASLLGLLLLISP
ncbi:hypothetical protein [Bosea sp. (in: a-proteobacteria)]|uniref:hypothetical protein n=1 Tax=Bosea sp. (in: a-proteobacteria) TaxID=1871050 RepID=UPI003B3AE7E8